MESVALAVEVDDLERWMRRSTRVTTQAAEENTSAHSEKGLLVVMSAGSLR